MTCKTCKDKLEIILAQRKNANWMKEKLEDMTTEELTKFFETKPSYLIFSGRVKEIRIQHTANILIIMNNQGKINIIAGLYDATDQCDIDEDDVMEIFRSLTDRKLDQLP